VHLLQPVDLVDLVEGRSKKSVNRSVDRSVDRSVMFVM